MEVVDLARVVLRRVGSASAAGIIREAEVRVLEQVADPTPNSLMEFVKRVAIKHGERPEALLSMRQAKGWSHEAKCEVSVFDVQGANVQYSYPYAECWSFPALKMGARYFRLDELRLHVG